MDDPSPRGGAAQMRAASGQQADAPSEAERRQPARRAAPKAKSASGRTAAAQPSAEQDQPPTTPRARGRPSIGKPTNVRLGDDEEQVALKLGRGSLAAGVREALRLARATVEPGAPTYDPGLQSVLLGNEQVQRLNKLGDGSPQDAVEMLLRAADVLGEEAVTRLGKGVRSAAGRSKG